MNTLLKHLGALTLISLVSQPLVADELKMETESLEILKSSVSERERKLEESENTVQQQSETLQCLNLLLEAYTVCETQHAVASPEHQQCLSTAKEAHPTCAT
jgi:hypothetical protein